MEEGAAEGSGGRDFRRKTEKWNTASSDDRDGDPGPRKAGSL